jgi:hypothetical protein
VANPVDLNLDVSQWWIDSLRGKRPLPLSEIGERMQTETFSSALVYQELGVELDMDEERIVALFELAIEQRLPALRSALFREPKPRAMPEAEWRRFKEITGVTAFQESHAD